MCELTRSRRTWIFPPLGSEFDRVGEQVPHDLLQACGVARNRTRERVEDLFDADLLHGRGRANRFNCRLDDGNRLELLHIKAELAGDDAAHVQQVFNELFLCPRVAFDGPPGLPHLVFVHGAQSHQLGPAHNGIEGRSQLVGERREELVLELVDALGLRAGDPLGIEQVLAFPLDALLVCDVAGDFGSPDDGSGRVTNGRNTERDLNEPTVLRQTLSLEVVDPLSLSQTP
jgi:hypothetical protein